MIELLIFATILIIMLPAVLMFLIIFLASDWERGIYSWESKVKKLQKEERK